jgi:superfamily I DNA and/or RNA helicase
LEVKITVELLLLLEEGYKKLKEKNPEEYKLSAGDGEKPSVAVITMYGKQIASIKTELKMHKDSFKHICIDISTVDNYQGKEQDIVLVNMVANTRNDEPGEFLQKFNRINVAISRARTMLIMVGSHTFYNKVNINVPDMYTGKDNLVNACYRVYKECESKWEASAGLFKINKEGAKA